ARAGPPGPVAESGSACYSDQMTRRTSGLQIAPPYRRGVFTLQERGLHIPPLTKGGLRGFRGTRRDDKQFTFAPPLRGRLLWRDENLGPKQFTFPISLVARIAYR